MNLDILDDSSRLLEAIILVVSRDVDAGIASIDWKGGVSYAWNKPAQFSVYYRLVNSLKQIDMRKYAELNKIMLKFF